MATVFTAAVFVSYWYIFSSAFMDAKKGIALYKRALFLLGAGLLYLGADRLVLMIFPQTSLLRTLLLLSRNLIATFIVMHLFEGRLAKKAFLNAFCISLNLLAETLLLVVVNQRQSALVDHINSLNASASAFVENGSVLLPFAVALLIRILRAKKPSFTLRSVSLYLLQAAIPLITIFWILYALFLSPTNDFTIIGILGVLFNAVAFALYNSLEKTHAENQRYALEQQRHELLEEYYKRVEAHQNEIRAIKHDMKNQLLALDGYIEAGDETAKGQIDALVAQLTEGEAESFTAHPGMNALLGAKYRLARQQGIVCDFTVRLPKEVGIAEQDLAAVVGNVLDNAIEACAHATGQRYIRFKLVYHNGALVLVNENSTDGRAKTLATRKEDTQNHGLGIGSIQRVVRQYGGDVQYQFGGHSFTIEITMFEKHDEKRPNS